MKQLSLDQALNEAHAYVRRDARPTSEEAALRAMPRSSTRRFMVLEAIVAAGEAGRTDDELIVELGLPHQSVGPRRLELVEGGWIEDSGQRRRTRTGADAIVWVLTEAGATKWRAVA